MLLLCGIALTSFGLFLLYQWQNAAESSKHPTPNYVYMLIALGAATAFSNLLGYCAACSGSRCLLAVSLTLLGLLLAGEVALGMVLLVDPELAEGRLCPAGDKQCAADIAELNAALHHPSERAGVLLLAVLGVQAAALLATCCLKCVHRSEGDMEESLLEDGERRDREREGVEARSRSRLARWTRLSDSTRAALQRQGRATPSPSWDSRPPPVNPEGQT